MTVLTKKVGQWIWSRIGNRDKESDFGLIATDPVHFEPRSFPDQYCNGSVNKRTFSIAIDAILVVVILQQFGQDLLTLFLNQFKTLLFRLGRHLID
jgi:hypothetical protein